MLWNFINNGKIPKHMFDYQFYLDAFDITGDKNIYNKCPVEVKTNYLFVLSLIEKFSDDKQFIDEVACNYLSVTDKSNYTYQELIFIMSDLMDVYGKNNHYNYQYERDIIYNSKKNMIRQLLKEEKLDEEYGLGFIIVLNNEQSEIIINYFATKFINGIFYNIVGYDLEEIIHMTYKDRFNFVTYGIDNFIIEFISHFDGYLAYYVKENMFLINDVYKYIKSITRNWNKYVRDNYSIKLEELELAIKSIISKYNSLLSVEEVYSYIDQKSLLLPVKLSVNDDGNNKVLSDRKTNISDYKCLKEALNIAENIFMCGEENKEKGKQSKAKILEFKLNDKG